MKYFVLSDVHSFFNEMMDALTRNGFDINDPNHKIILCGDLFDRGPDAVKCFEFAKQMMEQGRFFYICGNHELLLLDCLADLLAGKIVPQHHFSNGTFDTIVQFTGVNKYDLYMGLFDRKQFCEKMQPLVDMINETVNCVELDDKIFVHGWLPCNKEMTAIDENWDSDEANWDSATWVNGILAWHKGARLPNKTIVCGHWHCSWGWSHLRLKRKEFPSKNRIDWQKSFEPFVDEGIIAIDSCVAYTGFCNCIVFEKN